MSTLDLTLGLLFDAAVIGSAIYGAGCLQGWIYFRKYRKNDHWILQTMVILLLVFDTCQMAFLSAAVYKYCVTNQGNPDALAYLQQDLIRELPFSALIAFMTQQFYCYRIFLLSKNFFIAGPVSALSLSAFVTLFIYIARALKIVLLADLIELQTMSTVTNSLAAVTDIVISIVMILLLHVSKTGFKRSTDMINRLIIFTFNTGLPTSVCAIVAVVAINALSSTFVYIFFFILMGRFYTNSLLVTLNSRAYIRGMDTGGGSDSFSLTVPSSSRRPHGATVSHNTHQDPIAIRIETTRQRDHGYTPHIQDQDLKDNFEMSVAK